MVKPETTNATDLIKKVFQKGRTGTFLNSRDERIAMLQKALDQAFEDGVNSVELPDED